jgi:ABC-type phosphate transport system substrate-binding protein
MYNFATYQLRRPGRDLLTVLLTASLLATLFSWLPGVTRAAAHCPITVQIEGSTTVFPANQLAEGPFEGVWNPGTTATLASTGSGTGLNALRADQIDVAASSRSLNATELTELYGFNIGRDGFVIGVHDDPDMAFITNITMAQVEAIWEGTVNSWDDLDPTWPARSIIPRARIVESGSQPDFLGVFSVASASEAATIAATGLPRLVESSDMAAAAAANDDQIVYTSLANLNVAGLKVLTLNGIQPTAQTVQTSTYPALRRLWLAVHKRTDGPPRIDNSDLVRGDDFVNYMLSAAGQAHVGAAGFVQVPVPAGKPIPDFDINLDGGVGLADIGGVTGRWSQTSTCKGWIRADVNNDGGVGLADIGQITGRWSGTGFVPPN